jgi:putative molybdopterin biosynthesis protein
MATPAAALLTTSEVARLLSVHPKQVYRLLRKGLPGRRIGAEWRFDPAEVTRWTRQGGAAAVPDEAPSADAPPLVAANGDRVVLLLLRVMLDRNALVGLVQADRGEGLALLARSAVLATGNHAGGFPTHVGSERVARIHLVRREVGLVSRDRPPPLEALERVLLASRPATAGVRIHLDAALASAHLDAAEIHRRAVICESHLEVCAQVLQGRAQVGVASRAWAESLGLQFRPLAEEAYGLVARASELGHPALVALCEAAQSGRFRNVAGHVPGYDISDAGAIHYDGV